MVIYANKGAEGTRSIKDADYCREICASCPLRYPCYVAAGRYVYTSDERIFKKVVNER